MEVRSDLEEGEIVSSSPHTASLEVEPDNHKSVNEEGESKFVPARSLQLLTTISAFRFLSNVSTALPSARQSEEATSFLESLAVIPNGHQKPHPKFKVPKLIESDKKSANFPGNLLNQLRYNCQRFGLDKPSCVQPLWTEPGQALFPSNGRYNPFTILETKEVLSSARYAVGVAEQIVVVQQRSGGSFMDGKPVVIFLPPDQGQGSHIWRIWEPSYEGGSFNPSAPAVVRSRDMPSISSYVPLACWRASLPSPDTGSQVCHQHVQSSVTSSTSDQRYSRSASVKRKRMSSSTGAPDEEAPRRKQGSASPMVNIVATVVDTPTSTMQPRFEQLPMPMPTSGVEPCPVVRFKVSSWGPELRRRQYTECDTSHKLFSQAICAGIINAHDLVLRAELPGRRISLLMKGDGADFRSLEAEVNLQVKLCGTDVVQIVITRADD